MTMGVAIPSLTQLTIRTPNLKGSANPGAKTANSEAQNEKDDERAVLSSTAIQPQTNSHCKIEEADMDRKDSLGLTNEQSTVGATVVSQGSDTDSFLKTENCPDNITGISNTTELTVELAASALTVPSQQLSSSAPSSSSTIHVNGREISLPQIDADDVSTPEERRHALMRAVYLAGFRDAAKVSHERSLRENFEEALRQHGMEGSDLGRPTPAKTSLPSSDSLKRKVIPQVPIPNTAGTVGTCVPRLVQSSTVTSEGEKSQRTMVRSASAPVLARTSPHAISPDNVSSPRTPGSAAFPRKLIEMLAREDSSVVSWMPSGKSFIVRDTDVFVSTVLPKYFRHTKFPSFQRQLNLYGFRRMAKGPEAGAYHHVNFRRDDPESCLSMRRSRQKSSPLTGPLTSPRVGGKRGGAKSRSTSVSTVDVVEENSSTEFSNFKLDGSGKTPNDAQNVETHSLMSTTYSMSSSANNPFAVVDGQVTKTTGLSLMMNNSNLCRKARNTTSTSLHCTSVNGMSSGTFAPPAAVQKNAKPYIPQSMTSSVETKPPKEVFSMTSFGPQTGKGTCETSISQEPNEVIEDTLPDFGFGNADEMELDFCSLFSGNEELRSEAMPPPPPLASSAGGTLGTLPSIMPSSANIMPPPPALPFAVGEATIIPFAGSSAGSS